MYADICRMLAGLTGALFSYILLTAFTAESAKHASLSYGVIVSVFLFGIIFSWGYDSRKPLKTHD